MRQAYDYWQDQPGSCLSRASQARPVGQGKTSSSSKQSRTVEFSRLCNFASRSPCFLQLERQGLLLLRCSSERSLSFSQRFGTTRRYQRIRNRRQRHIDSISFPHPNSGVPAGKAKMPAYRQRLHRFKESVPSVSNSPGKG